MAKRTRGNSGVQAVVILEHLRIEPIWWNTPTFGKTVIPHWHLLEFQGNFGARATNKYN
jgi:hypothetical protein